MFRDLLKTSVEFKSIEEHLQVGLLPTAVFGVEHASFLWNILALKEKNSKMVLVLENESACDQMRTELEQHLDDVVFLPKLDLVFFEAYSHSHQVENERLHAMYTALEAPSYLMITTSEALMHPMIAPSSHQNALLEVDLDQGVDMNDLLDHFVKFGYERVDVVEATGQFAVRGGIVDCYPPEVDHPVRLEFFGDDIDGMRYFALETQQSIENIEHVTIRPCREAFLLSHDIAPVLKRLSTLKQAYKDQKLIARIDQVIESIKENQFTDAWHMLTPVLYEKTYSFFEYAKEALWITDAFNRQLERVDGKYTDWLERFESHLMRQEVLPEQVALLMRPQEWVNHMNQCRHLTFTGLKTPIKALKLQAIVDYHFQEAPIYRNQLTFALQDLSRMISKDYHVLLMAGDENKARGLKTWLEEAGIHAYDYTPGVDLKSKRVWVSKTPFTSGFIIDTFKWLVVTDHELFGADKRIKRRKPIKNARAIKSFSDLNTGDYVVHESHGIGVYQGVFQLKVDGKKKDFLKVAYKGDDSLYVPVEKMDVLQKYLGQDQHVVKLNKLGSVEWKNTTTRVKKAIEDMTDDLIALYAEREKRVGFAFSSDNEWTQQFADYFPYQETPDQLKSIEDIKKDMEIAKPMDRLLCGDVGYGKTEVAMRAVFKAVNDSKQVAILVPTTILAQQHYNTLMHRFSQYPVTIGSLSRFRSKKEQHDIIEGLRTGVVDVVVGTHRLLSKDIAFKDLGLLVVDEEQRFGVKHKEKIKQLKASVDVLTLSATPIPRTLHMSLVGIRDMSLIEDPPEDRYPIQTYVLEHQDGPIREAILRELDRNGQVYYVHNRVEDIQEVTEKLRNLVPEARITLGHGQMNEHKLEKVMFDFLDHAFDVLVCTTIIETGLDISNVNTIIINHADQFGLSQLYQLRGRVGRSNRLAYAYLTYQKKKVLSEIAEKRLRAIKEFTDLGSGFKIAMRDLELRGAGNLLGAQQHGHLASVGYEMYCKMLEEAVRHAKGEQVKEAVDTSVELISEAYVPKFYIDDSRFKIDLYKRISAIRHRQDKEGIEEDLYDFYGKIPDPVQHLIDTGYIKTLAQMAGVEHVKQHPQVVHLLYSKTTKVNPLLISDVLSQYNERDLKFIGAEQSRFEVNIRRFGEDTSAIMARVIEVLEAMQPKVN